MKKYRSLLVGVLFLTALAGYGCGNSGSTNSSGPAAGSFNNDTFSVSPVDPGPSAAQGLPVIADPITTNNKLVVKCEPATTTTPLLAHMNSICKRSNPQDELNFTCLNGKVQGYLQALNCERLTLNCNESGFSQESCEEDIQD